MPLVWEMKEQAQHISCQQFVMHLGMVYLNKGLNLVRNMGCLICVLSARSFEMLLRQEPIHLQDAHNTCVVRSQAGQGFTNSTLTRDYQPYLIPDNRESLSHPLAEPSAPVQIMWDKRRFWFA